MTFGLYLSTQDSFKVQATTNPAGRAISTLNTEKQEESKSLEAINERIVPCHAMTIQTAGKLYMMAWGL